MRFVLSIFIVLATALTAVACEVTAPQLEKELAEYANDVGAKFAPLGIVHGQAAKDSNAIAAKAHDKAPAPEVELVVIYHLNFAKGTDRYFLIWADANLCAYGFYITDNIESVKALVKGANII